MPKLPEIGVVVFAHLKHPRAIACTAFLALGAAIAANALLFQPRPHPAPLFATRAPVQRSTETGDPLVREIQEALSLSGRYSGTVDGIAGPQTEAAIQSFEEAAGLPATGQASAELLAEINRASEAPQGEPATADPLVASVQSALALAAYGPLTADGVVGPDTRAAIVRFQRDHNLPVSGEISDGLIVELRAVGAMRGG